MTVPKLSKSTTLALSAAAIGVAALAAYGNSLHTPFVFDDLLAIGGNRTIRSFASALHPPSGGSTVSGRPLLNLSFALNYALGGADTVGYHAANLAIHVAAALVLLGILRRTFALLPGVFRSISAEVAAFTAALLWTVHPLQTESVTYVVQRAESLMGLFYLVTLYCFIRGTETGRTEAGWGIVPPDSELRKARTRAEPAAGPLPFDRSRRPEARDELRYEPGGTIPHPASSSRLWLTASWLACLLGMATKEVMVSAPVIVLLYDRTFVAGSFREALRRWRFYGCLAGTWIPLAFLVAATHGRYGTSGFGIGVPWFRYALTQFPAVVRYLELAFWPHPLVVDYGAQWVTRPWTVLPEALAVAALLAGAGFAFSSKRRELRALGFAGLWFFALLAPTSLVPGARQTMAEHRMYLALAPVLAAVVGAGARLLISVAGRAAFAAWTAAAAAAAAVLASATASRNRDYRSERDLWAATVARVPGNPHAQCNYGAALYRDGDISGARARFEEAVQIDPDYAEAQNNLGTALSRARGMLPEAIAHYERAVSLNPDYADAQNNLAAALEKIPGREAEAIAHLERALRTDPSFVDARCNLAALLSGMPGRESEALAQYAIALQLDPGSAKALMGVALAHFNHARALSSSPGRTGEAIQEYRRALRLAPNLAEAHYDLALELAKAPGNEKEVIAHYEAAIRLEPAFEDAHNNLAIAYAQAGRIPEAIEQAEAALKLDPGDAARRNLAALQSLKAR